MVRGTTVIPALVGRGFEISLGYIDHSKKKESLSVNETLLRVITHPPPLLPTCHKSPCGGVWDSSVSVSIHGLGPWPVRSRESRELLLSAETASSECEWGCTGALGVAVGEFLTGCLVCSSHLVGDLEFS